MVRLASAFFLIGTGSGTSINLQLSDSFLGKGSTGHPDSAHFAAFIQNHARSYQVGSKEYETRFAAFQERLAVVNAQNARPDRLWSAAVNSLADWTPEELQSLRGYRHGAKASSSSSGVGLIGAQSAVHGLDVAGLPDDFTWQGRLNAMKDVQDQGGCGSCWAVASSTVLRAHAELYQSDRTFSTQQIVACTPNPQQCGGSGGCGGATAELAMDYVAKAGLVTAEDMQYTASNGKCPTEMQLNVASAEAAPSLRSTPLRVMALSDVTIQGGGGAKFGMTGWQKLPENKAEPLLLALYKHGPVAVSVAAGDTWSMYSSGVLDACEKGAVINHAVVLTGYGKEGPHKYWQIQNSWGPGWGEGGFVRLLRHDMKEEDSYCGWDKSPEQGTACKGGPSKVWVCGSCGVLYDSVVPKFTLGKDGWWARQGGRNISTTAV
mmetsp:Transcript_144841/g.367576  ORF Transcript_144841/g.367576 Transcript_144841/m.367576 type:complete len:434 (+) Transcript_144841:70-1371(+)